VGESDDVGVEEGVEAASLSIELFLVNPGRLVIVSVLASVSVLAIETSYKVGKEDVPDFCGNPKCIGLGRGREKFVDGALGGLYFCGGSMTGGPGDGLCVA